MRRRRGGVRGRGREKETAPEEALGHPNGVRWGGAGTGAQEGDNRPAGRGKKTPGKAPPRQKSHRRENSDKRAGDRLERWPKRAGAADGKRGRPVKERADQRQTVNASSQRLPLIANHDQGARKQQRKSKSRTEGRSRREASGLVPGEGKTSSRFMRKVEGGRLSIQRARAMRVGGLPVGEFDRHHPARRGWHEARSPGKRACSSMS